MTQPNRVERVASRLIQWAVVVSAVCALPADMFAPHWLALFALPGLTFLWLATGSREHWLGFAWRLVVGVTMVLGLSIGIYQTEYSPAPQAALTYLLISPLTYASLRNRPLDVLHSLFLAFCMLVISAILSNGVDSTIVLITVAGAAFVLQNEARRLDTLNRGITTAAPLGPSARWRRRGSVALGCILAFVGTFSLLRTLPLPNQKRSNSGRNTQVGMTSQFDLDSTGPLDLVAGELLRVQTPGEAPPTDLYLRATYFDVPGFQQWGVRPRSDFGYRDLRQPGQFRGRVRGLRTRQVLVHRLDAHRGMIFVPPGTYDVSGSATLRIHTELEAYHQPGADGPLQYGAQYQDLRALALGRPASTRLPGLTDLPPEIDRRDDYRRLALEWTRGAGDEPTAIALALAEGLQDRCTYALENPKGPHRLALDNFLFGNRRGYCMHFASTLAIMLRMVGVPSRVAGGLYGGRPDEADPDIRVFGSPDAHAWVEVPIRGLGWVPFDATPPATLRGATSRIPDLASLGDDAFDEEDLAIGGGAAALRWLRRLPFGTIAPWVALVALVGVTLFAPRRDRKRSGSSRPTTRDDRQTRRHLERLLRALAKLGAPRRSDESLEQYAATLAASDLDLDLDAMQSAFRAYQDVRFGGRPLTPERESALRSALAGLPQS